MAELTAADVDDRTDALLAEAEAYFMGEGGVHSAAAAIAGRLAAAGIDYAIAGAIARLDPYLRNKFQELRIASQHPEDDD